MKAVIGLQLMLIGVCCGMESSCNARKKEVRCFGALGGTVNLRIMNKATKLSKFIWAKKRSQLFHWRSQKIVARTEDNRFSFFPHNGTVKITNLRRHDSGLYQLVVFKKGRKRKVIRTLKLFIEAPVSTPWVVSKCTSSGEQRVFCFPEEEGNYVCKWTMNKKPLKNSKYFSGYAKKRSEPYYEHDKTCTILLQPKATGHLRCLLKNHISYSFMEIKITSCAKERWNIQLPKKKEGANKPTVPRKPSKNKKGQKKTPKVPPKSTPKEKDGAKKPKVPPTLSPEEKDGGKKTKVPQNLSPKEKDGAEKPTVPPKPSPKEKDGAKKPKVPPKTSPKEKDEVKKPTVPPTPSPEKKDGKKKPKVPSEKPTGI
ncbi:triadin-like isoform X2 [Poeciliopsis prolifica]|uniref:triadin-like isoform X2 n=1 Tax=Poeciliopsis prolifica TaxID=188132 RepID=UPI0024145ABC|nr:triadin-like isoform X2 [Poeciliopsis prolifica]